MDWEVIAPMVVMLALIVTTGGVILLYPISKRLGQLLEAMTQEKRAGTLQKELAQARELMATMESRLSLLEERQSFSEALLDSSPARSAPRELPPQR